MVRLGSRRWERRGPSRFSAQVVLAGPAKQRPGVSRGRRRDMWWEVGVGGILQEEEEDGAVVGGAVGCTSGGLQARPIACVVPGASGPPAWLYLVRVAPLSSSPTPSPEHFKKC